MSKTLRGTNRYHLDSVEEDHWQLLEGSKSTGFETQCLSRGILLKTVLDLRMAGVISLLVKQMNRLKIRRGAGTAGRSDQ